MSITPDIGDTFGIGTSIIDQVHGVLTPSLRARSLRGEGLKPDAAFGRQPIAAWRLRHSDFEAAAVAADLRPALEKTRARILPLW